VALGIVRKTVRALDWTHRGHLLDDDFGGALDGALGFVATLGHERGRGDGFLGLLRASLSGFTKIRTVL